MTSTLPPNTFSGAKDIGILGVIDASGYFRSAYFTSEMVSTAHWRSIFYKFISDGGFLTLETREYPEGSSFVRMYDQNQDQYGPSSYGGPNTLITNQELAKGLFYIESATAYTTSGRVAEYDLGLIVVPSDPGAYRDSGSYENPKDIGTNPNFSAGGSLYTLFDRAMASDGKGGLQVLTDTALVSDASDAWDFEITKAGKLDISFGGTHGTAVLFMNVPGIGGYSTAVQFNGSKSLDVRPGTYKLAVFDTESNPSLSGGIGVVTRTDHEAYNLYDVGIKFTETAAAKPDLAFSKFDGKIAGTRLMNVEYTVTNSTGDVASSVRIYLSTNATISNRDTWLATDYFSTGSDGVYSGSEYVKLNFRAGTYYLGVIVDSNDLIDEVNDGNNVSHADAFRITSSGKLIELTDPPHRSSGLDGGGAHVAADQFDFLM